MAIGVLSLESLITGMYEKMSLVTFREYIQNSCDAIDDAFDAGILSAGDELITIDIDAAARRIIIEDNGTGISVFDFKSRLSDIGCSEKNLQTDRGFRGIGRLCGLAYCRELRFIATARGENIQSTIIFNAAKLRAIFNENKDYSAQKALDEIISCDTNITDTDEHFFRVELIDIVDTNSALLDVEKVCDYLSFVAPSLDNLIAMWRRHHERKIFTAQERRPFIAQSRLCNSRRNASRFFFAVERRRTSSRRKANG